MFFESYGNAAIRALTRASREFLENPPAGFSDVPLLTPRACLFVAEEARLDRLDAKLAAPDVAASLYRVSAAEAPRRLPILRTDWVAGAVADDSGQDIDVAALLQGCLPKTRRAGCWPRARRRRGRARAARRPVARAFAEGHFYFKPDA